MSEDSLCIRPMIAVDIDSVSKIEFAVSPSPWSVSQFSESLACHQCVVLESKGQVVGFTIWSQILDEAELLNIAVSPEFQGRGYGSLLLRNLVEKLANSVVSLYLEVRVSNFPAIRLYKNYGFVENGHRRDYYKTALGREDALLMALPIAESNSAGNNEAGNKLTRIK